MTAARRVILVDDHGLFRAGVRSALGPDIDIIGEAGSVAEAVPLIRDLSPTSSCLTYTSPTAVARRSSPPSRPNVPASGSSPSPFPMPPRT